MMEIERTEEEIEELLNEAYARADVRSKFPGMSYEEGIKSTLEWLTNLDWPNPLDD